MAPKPAVLSGVGAAHPVRCWSSIQTLAKGARHQRAARRSSARADEGHRGMEGGGIHHPCWRRGPGHLRFAADLAGGGPGPGISE